MTTDAAFPAIPAKEIFPQKTVGNHPHGGIRTPRLTGAVGEGSRAGFLASADGIPGRWLHQEKRPCRFRGIVSRIGAAGPAHHCPEARVRSQRRRAIGVDNGSAAPLNFDRAWFISLMNKSADLLAFVRAQPFLPFFTP